MSTVNPLNTTQPATGTPGSVAPQGGRGQKLQNQLTQAGITNVTADQLLSQVKQTLQASGQPPAPGGFQAALDSALAQDGVSQTQISGFDTIHQQYEQQEKQQREQNLQNIMTQAGITNVTAQQVCDQVQQLEQSQPQTPGQRPDRKLLLDTVLKQDGATTDQLTSFVTLQQQQRQQQGQQHRIQGLQNDLTQAGITNVDPTQLMSLVKQGMDSLKASGQVPSPQARQQVMDSALQQLGASSTQVSAFDALRQQQEQQHKQEWQQKRAAGLQKDLTQAGITNVDPTQLMTLVKQGMDSLKASGQPPSQQARQQVMDSALQQLGASSTQISAFDTQRQQEAQQRKQEHIQKFQDVLNLAGLNNANAQQILDQVKSTLQASGQKPAPGAFQAALNNVLQQDGASQSQISLIDALAPGKRRGGPPPTAPATATAPAATPVTTPTAGSAPASG